jgi:hypothetical protein
MLHHDDSVISYNPNGKDYIKFFEKNHLYIDNKKNIYESSTQFVKKYFNIFDVEKMSVECSKSDNPKYKNLTSKQILKMWQEKGLQAGNDGTNIHLFAEKKMMNDIDDIPEPLNERCARIFIQADYAIDELKKYYEFVAAEMIVYSFFLKKSGMIDLLMYSRKSNELIIFDWKTNEDLTTENNFQTGLKPIEYLQDTDLTKYSLQLSFYEFILKREHYFKKIGGYRRALIHLQDDSFKIINLEDYSFEIGNMLKQEGFKI